MEKIILPDNYPYLYETHLHTNAASRCASCDPCDVAAAYLRMGYSGIVITEHNWGGHTAISRALPWKDWVDQFVAGYYRAKQYGDAHGLDVFWGYEAGFNATEFLVYGLSPGFLHDNPQIRHSSLEEHYHTVKSAGGFIIHAHPFREADYIAEQLLVPWYCDAVEAINAGHHNRFMDGATNRIFDERATMGRATNRIFDERATAYGNKHGLPLTAGSDMHNVNLYGAGMAFRDKPRDYQEMVEIIKKGEDYLLTNGVNWYDNKGNPIGAVSFTDP